MYIFVTFATWPHKQMLISMSYTCQLASTLHLAVQLDMILCSW